ncbi:hypothetical protein [Dactylosporangium sp. NPDC000521]|uniref:hypothetical protein n=1 Tax=Dactylosporangium sp. NPDC000521 TaxID=3363975 RepID=UPI00369E9722
MRHWWIVLLGFAGLVVTALFYGDAAGPAQTRHRPTAYSDLGPGGDPDTIVIRFDWPHDGWCSGQFTIAAAETSTEVRVGDVVSKTQRPGANCAGLGSDGTTAWDSLTLSRPLGDRRVVRADDGAALPYVRRGPPE